jgi:DNA helicase-2/ATP-dependent DNA helicase PcrA
MHDAVSRYFQHKMTGQEITAAGLLALFREGFDPQGFLDVKHQEERLKVGEGALIRFFNDEKVRNSRPKFIEKDFSFPLGDIKISGRFDRVDEDERGVTIIDFKTSDIKTQKDAVKRIKENKQLVLYSLAYKNIFGLLPSRIELFFLESGLTADRKVEEEDFTQILEEVKKVASGIRTENFQATPDYNNCNYCAYSQICPFALVR